MNIANDDWTESEDFIRLFELILDLPQQEQIALLNELESKRSLQEKRKYTRKPFFMAVDYVTQGRAYSDFIQDISDGGVFIETCMPFSLGQEISMTFPLPKNKQHYRISGKIVRTSPQGIGVRFKGATDDVDRIKTLLKKIRNKVTSET